MAHDDAREGKWRGNWGMEWVASTLHTSSEHGVSSITTADAHTSAASSRLNWRSCRFKWIHPFRRKTKSVFCACAITFQLACTTVYSKKRNVQWFKEVVIRTMYVQHHVYSNYCAVIRYSNTQTSGNPLTHFSLFRPSSGKYSTNDRCLWPVLLAMAE